MKGIALVLSGPSGAGKSTVIGHLRKHLPELKFSISCTTRAPRPGETHGVHYYFCSKEEFQQKVDAKAMLEYAHVHLDSYGTPAEPVLSAVDNGEVMLLHPTSRTNAEILGEIITEIKAQGYRFGTLDELCT
jgi:guanylate kinase